MSQFIHKTTSILIPVLLLVFLTACQNTVPAGEIVSFSWYRGSESLTEEFFVRFDRSEEDGKPKLSASFYDADQEEFISSYDEDGNDSPWDLTEEQWKQLIDAVHSVELKKKSNRTFPLIQAQDGGDSDITIIYEEDHETTKVEYQENHDLYTPVFQIVKEVIGD